MFGRAVTVDGREVWVWCVPDTPLSEVLERAAAVLRREEHDRNENSAHTLAYRTMRAQAFT